jgi:competence protein ComGC
VKSVLYLLLVLGMILLVVFLPEAVRQQRQENLEDKGAAGNLEPVLKKMQELQQQVELLHESFLEIKSQHFLPAERAPALNFARLLEEKKLPPAEDDFKQAVISSFEKGRTITEIAREFGKGKGEIELILNLRR